MFDTSQRSFLLRKNFKNYGPEDRLRYRYQGDTFNAYSQRDTENALKHGFKYESVPFFLAEQNGKVANNKGDSFIDDIAGVFQFLFEETLLPEISNGLGASFGLQASLLEKLDLQNGQTILELGAGSGLLAPLYLGSSHTTGVTYVVVEAIPQLLVLQQAVLKYFALKNGNYSYCSSLESYPRLREDSSKNIVLHVNAWDLDQLDIQADIVVANNVLDQVSDSDFKEYLGALEEISKPETKLSVWGGVERGGVSDLYLFGYGTYHGYDVIKTLRERYDLLDLRKEGSEYYALFECNKTREEDNLETITSIERKEIERHVQNIDFLWVDDNSSFLNVHDDLLASHDLVSASSSVSTAPLPCGIKRTNILDRKISKGDKMLVCSYRWQGVRIYFEEKNWRVVVDKISDKVVLMELTK